MPDRADPLAHFHPILARWFTDTLGAPSAPQRGGWPAIATGAHTLLLAPTGTGKTLAAFLQAIDDLIRRGRQAPLPNAIAILYVSPLKALNNDIERNLQRPLAELAARFADAGEPFPGIRVGVRTGDTPAAARARMIRRTPHILITTPESLHIMLTTTRGRGMFSHVRTVIIDEIHAVAGSKRGAHLALTLERLEALTTEPPQRIGLSATQRPLDEVARFLGGMEADAPRPVTIVDCGLVKRMELEVVAPVGDLTAPHGSIWPHLVERVLRLVRDGTPRTTLVFVNNRGLAERLSARLNTLAGDEISQPYHGSIARERRQLLEARLKAGELRTLVTTSSLELGIDIGSVDLVIQVQSPKRVASGLQRVGRAGHVLGATSRGVFIPTHLEDALEMLVIVGAMRDGEVEPTTVIQNALDVLAQVIVAAVSVDDWRSADLFAMIRRAWPFHALSREAFDEVLSMLAGKYPADVAAELAQRITWDRTTDRLTGSRGGRLAAVTSGGTIPDRGLYPVMLGDRTRLGELDEEFVHESRVGDAFQLGSNTWRIHAIEQNRVFVTPAAGAPARMPFWHGEYMARAAGLAPRVGAMRDRLARLDPDDEERVSGEAAALGAEPDLVRALATWVRRQREVVRVLPTDRDLVLETFRDETGAVRMILHAPFGSRVLAPWALALAHRLRERLTGVDVQVQTSDDGILFRLPDLGTDPPSDVIRELAFDDIRLRMIEEVDGSSLFGARFRMNAARALLLSRGAPGKRMPLWLQRLKALDLLQTVREFPRFPILIETYREVMQDAFDLTALRSVLAGLEGGTIRIHRIALDRPSPFSTGLQMGFVQEWLYVDDTPRGARQSASHTIDRELLDDLIGTHGADDELLRELAIVVAERAGTAPGRRGRTADELAGRLERAGDCTPDEARARVATVEEGRAGDPLGELLASGRVKSILVPTAAGESERLVLSEHTHRYAAAFGADSVRSEPARREILARLLATAGPLSIAEIRNRYAFDEAWLERRLDAGTRSGRLVRGVFGDATIVRWCSRRLLDLARRRALARARRAVQAVPFATYAAMLQQWQFVDPRARRDGAAGVSDVMRQMIGLERPAESWERDLLPSRVNGYEPALLDALTQSGELVWVAGDGIRFVERGSAGRWLPPPTELALSDAASRVMHALEAAGASFASDLEAATALDARAVRTALLELSRLGLVTSDSAEAMRAVIAASPRPTRRERAEEDPSSWLPAGFERGIPFPSRASGRGRRRHRGRGSRGDGGWRRGGDSDDAMVRAWRGRWSLVRSARVLGADESEMDTARAMALKWLDRYAIVSRESWKNEQVVIPWRAIYRELRTMEMRGEVRRGYFVEGLSGAQFALPEALDALRQAGAAAETDRKPPWVVVAGADPANAWALPRAMRPAWPPRPGARSTLLVTRHGEVRVAAESRGRRLRLAGDVDEAELTGVLEALAGHVERAIVPPAARRREVRIEQIDGTPAASHPLAGAFEAAGFRRDGMAFRRLPPR